MPRLFISYSRKDSTRVDRLIAALESAGHVVWVDRAGISTGSQWRTQIVEAIKASDRFVIVLSSNSFASDNVRRELDIAVESHIQILPLDLEPITIPSEFRYQLAGLQRLYLAQDFNSGVGALLRALNTGTPPPGAHPSAVDERSISNSRLQRWHWGKLVILWGWAGISTAFLLGFSIETGASGPSVAAVGILLALTVATWVWLPQRWNWAKLVFLWGWGGVAVNLLLTIFLAEPVSASPAYSGLLFLGALGILLALTVATWLWLPSPSQETSDGG